MEKDTTIRVSRKNLERLRRIAALIGLSNGKKTKLNDALTEVLNKFEHEPEKNPREKKKEQDRKKLLELLNQPIEGAGPEDYKELEYDD